MNAGVEVHATLVGHTRIDFDKKKIKQVLRSEGGQIRKLARREVARRVVSLPGEMPGKATGRLMRSIKVKVSSGGFWARVSPFKTNEMPMFYPAVLHYGSEKRGIAKRANYMAFALDRRREPARNAIGAALRNSLKPR